MAATSVHDHVFPEPRKRYLFPKNITSERPIAFLPTLMDGGCVQSLQKDAARNGDLIAEQVTRLICLKCDEG